MIDVKYVIIPLLVVASLYFIWRATVKPVKCRPQVRRHPHRPANTAAAGSGAAHVNPTPVLGATQTDHGHGAHDDHHHVFTSGEKKILHVKHFFWGVAKWSDGGGNHEYRFGAYLATFLLLYGFMLYLLFGWTHGIVRGVIWTGVAVAILMIIVALRGGAKDWNKWEPHDYLVGKAEMFWSCMLPFWGVVIVVTYVLLGWLPQERARVLVSEARMVRLHEQARVNPQASYWKWEANQGGVPNLSTVAQITRWDAGGVIFQYPIRGSVSQHVVFERLLDQNGSWPEYGTWRGGGENGFWKLDPVVGSAGTPSFPELQSFGGDIWDTDQNGQKINYGRFRVTKGLPR